jgi:type I restriction enzyme S subunit
MVKIGESVTDRNENKPGYKKTKVGWIPTDWDCKKIKNCCRIAQGQANPTKKEYWNFYHIGPENIESNTGRILGVKTAKELGLRSGKYLFDSNSIVYSKKRPNLNKVCIPAFKGLCSADCYPIWPTGNNSRQYLFHYLLSVKFLQQSIPVSLRTGMPKINRQDLNLLYVILPTNPEQKKIAKILSTWDAAIEQTRKLIDAKKRLKKALMQQLLSGKTKPEGFEKDSWNIVPFGKLVSPVSRPVAKPEKPYLSIGLRSHCKGTFHRYIDEPKKIMMDTLYKVESEDLIVNITFAWEGAIAFATENDSGGLVSHRFPTFRIKSKNANIEFVRNLILTKRFIWDLGLISPGGAGRNRVMNKKGFLKIKVHVPSKKSQEKIGQVLQAADNEITYLQKKLKALEKQKRGLMQKLLAGEIRVKVNNSSDKVKDES